MKYRNWQIPYTAPQPPEALLRAGYSPLLAVLLALRGYADPVQARAFLSGGDQSAFDPMLLQDMDKAVARIRTAIERRENVAVFGDYDVDGITSTCVLTDYLRRQGVPVHPYIPDRIEEGYGLNMDAITNLQRTSDITLIITVDCGITAIDETNYALQLRHRHGHHRPPRVQRAGDARTPWPSSTRSAPARSTRTAGSRAWAWHIKLFVRASRTAATEVLREYARPRRHRHGGGRDAAHGREPLSRGAAGWRRSKRPPAAGHPRAAARVRRATGRPVTATTIGFTLAPRINAAGRLGKTAVAALLLLTNDDGEADRYAAGLCQLNRERQALEQRDLGGGLEPSRAATRRGCRIVLAERLRGTRA